MYRRTEFGMDGRKGAPEVMQGEMCQSGFGHEPELRPVPAIEGSISFRGAEDEGLATVAGFKQVKSQRADRHLMRSLVLGPAWRQDQHVPVHFTPTHIGDFRLPLAGQ